ncbi:hypothetical protein IFM89_020537 [Coptis chinensis]|uniref:EF-hand domain-containing protein n=1 Tax=Coptis chinensis TaxID=261450 RepID=A0A835HFZ0_9MAGN|nr:hypothetical protein IFM89_020537 [Coptis chinensis]
MSSSTKMYVNVNEDKRVIDEEQPFSPDCIRDVSCTTFNILAPIYKRLNSEESEFREYWLSRNQSILDRLLQLRSSIICLQEFWVGNEELVGMYERRLNDAGYATYKLARTNNRGDGLLTAVRRSQFQLLHYKHLLFNDFGDRVAQLLHIDLVLHSSQNQATNVKKEALLVNTHLLFPHNSGYCLHRLQQVYKMLQYIESFCEEYQLPQMPIILCGDWNGSKKGHVYKFLRSQGFVSSYDIAHHYTDSDADANKWVSHRNHRGNICAVDFIWLLNPNNPRKLLKESFIEAVLGNIKTHLSEESVESADQIHVLRTKFNNSNYITYSQFCQSLIKLGLTSNCPYGLSDEEIKDLWDYVDTDRDGVIDLSQFNTMNSPSFQQREDKSEDTEIQEEILPDKSKISTTIGFDVKNAVLFPPEVEHGMWPEYYSLSDHAHLTVEFAPMMIHCL